MEQSGNICWLRVTDYMQGWMRTALGGSMSVKGQPVLSVRLLDGVREVMMMPTNDEMPKGGVQDAAMSATWRNALEAGLALDPAVMEKEFGASRELLRQYVPIACPRKSVSKDGILRPWTNDTCLGKRQAIALTRLLRDEFWKAVERFSEEYAGEHQGEKYAQVEMIEAFCKATHTDDTHVEAMRREWQRRCKRGRS